MSPHRSADAVRDRECKTDDRQTLEESCREAKACSRLRQRDGPEKGPGEHTSVLPLSLFNEYRNLLLRHLLRLKVWPMQKLRGREAADPSRHGETEHRDECKVHEDHYLAVRTMLPRTGGWVRTIFQHDASDERAHDTADTPLLLTAGVYARRSRPLLDVRLPEVGTLSSRQHRLVIRALASDPDVLCEKKLEDTGDLLADEERSGI
jgi:hypothetical protein